MSEAKGSTKADAQTIAPDTPSAGTTTAAPAAQADGKTTKTAAPVTELAATGPDGDETALVPDESANDNDDDSLRAESIASSTTSVHSSVLQYRLENGRTYHSYKEGKYAYPNDARENERLDIQHNMFILTFDGRLGTAPPNELGADVGRVLDVGTGTGVWAMDFGEDHPEDEVLGVDLSAIQPDFTFPNVKFLIDDIEEPWVYGQPFDYIHSRMMTSSIKNWKEYVMKCYENLSPGGYLELNEIDLTPRCDDGTLKEDSALLKFARLWGEAAAKFGRPMLEDLSVLKDVMAEVGFGNVQANMFKWPSNPWARDPKHKELGYWNLSNSVAGLEGLMMGPLTRGHQWSEAEVNVFAMQVRKEMTDRSIHSYGTIWSIYGRKPADNEK